MPSFSVRETLKPYRQATAKDDLAKDHSLKLDH